MCQHQPRCPECPAPDYLAARIVADQPSQGWSLLCNGVIADALRPVPRGDGTTDLYIVAERFHAQFCADVPAAEAARMAVTQRPVALEALTEPSGGRRLWREVPSWFLISNPRGRGGARDRLTQPAPALEAGLAPARGPGPHTRRTFIPRQEKNEHPKWR